MNLAPGSREGTHCGPTTSRPAPTGPAQGGPVQGQLPQPAVPPSDAGPERDSGGLPWLFSPTVDLIAFLGSAVVAWGLLAVGAGLGWLHQPAPDWLWIAAVLLIDVAHVYATAFRTYFDPVEWRRRPWLYGLVPLLSLGLGMALYSESPELFWRVLAYLAVFHFIRQQAGWVALYRSRGQERGRVGGIIDMTAIYLATLSPLAYWHTHDRKFAWFVEGDFVRWPQGVEWVLAVACRVALMAYVVRSVWRGIRWQAWSPGKDIVVLTTAICWHLGIVTFDSDYAFTVTNVIIHGVPYLVLIAWYREQARRVRGQEGAGQQQSGTGEPPSSRDANRGRGTVIAADQLLTRHPVAGPGHVSARRARGGNVWTRWGVGLAVVWGLAFAEELLWDCGVWHERPWLFGASWSLDEWQPWLVPLLAVPQVTHYVLDGFIWRRRGNPELATVVARPLAAE